MLRELSTLLQLTKTSCLSCSNGDLRLPIALSIPTYNRQVNVQVYTSNTKHGTEKYLKRIKIVFCVLLNVKTDK